MTEALQKRYQTDRFHSPFAETGLIGVRVGKQNCGFCLLLGRAGEPLLRYRTKVKKPREKNGKAKIRQYRAVA